MTSDCAYLYELPQDNFYRDYSETMFNTSVPLYIYLSKTDINSDMPIFAGPSDYFEVVLDDNYITNNIGIERININRASNPDYIGIMQYMMKMIDVNMHLRSSPSYQYNDITNMPEIQKMLSNKVTDPAIALQIETFCMYIYKGIIPMAKSDKVSLTIYPFIDPSTMILSNRFGAEFTIYKKRNTKVVVLIYYVNLI